MLNEAMVCDLVQGLREIFAQNVLQIILYGSVARNEETSESDIDIAIIVNAITSTDAREKFLEWNAEMDMKYNRVFSIVDIDREQMERWSSVLPFYKNL